MGTAWEPTPWRAVQRAAWLTTRGRRVILLDSNITRELYNPRRRRGRGTFLVGLEGRNANDAAALILKLRARGNQLRPPDSEVVTGQRNLFELRGHQIRIFYMFRPGREIVLLDGIIKKQDRIPRADLERVLGYQRQVEQRGPRAP